MRVKEITKWNKRLSLLRISTIAIVVTAILSASVMAVTYYGSQVGNYIVTIQDDSLLGLSLSETSDFGESTGTLLAEGIRKLTNITYGDIAEEAFTHEGGSHNSYAQNGLGKYFAYTFYLRNDSTQGVRYAMNVYAIERFLNVDSAVRILVLRERQDGTTSTTIFAKARADGTPETHLQSYLSKTYTTVPFLDNDPNLLCYEYDTLDLREIVKYTVILWLEGEDAECIDDIKGGAFRIGMDFSIVADAQD